MKFFEEPKEVFSSYYVHLGTNFTYFQWKYAIQLAILKLFAPKLFLSFQLFHADKRF